MIYVGVKRLWHWSALIVKSSRSLQNVHTEEIVDDAALRFFRRETTRNINDDQRSRRSDTQDLHGVIRDSESF